MAADRVVRIILEGNSASVVKAFDEAGLAATKTQTKFETMQKVGAGMVSVGKTMTAMAVPLVALGAYSVKTAASFQKSMEMIRTQAGQSQTEVNNMSKAVLNMAPSLGSSTTDLADGLYHVESAGFHGAQALKMLTIAAEGAKVGNANLTDVTNAMDAAVVSGIKGVSNYKQAMGALNATVGAGDMKMQDLADALSTGLLGPMKTYGLTINEVGGALATFGDNNIRGQEAATKLQSAIRIMAAPSIAASKALASIGLSSTALATDMHGPNGLVQAFKDLKTHLAGSGKTVEQQALTITRAFGGRQSTGVQLLLNQLPRLALKTSEVAKGAVGFGAAWQATQKNVSFQWDKLKATAQVALVHLGDALLPLVLKILPPLVSDLSAVGKWIGKLPKPVLDVVAGFTAFLAIGGPILMIFGKMISIIGTVGSALEGLKIATIATSTVMKATIVGFIIFALIELILHFKQVKMYAAEVWQSIVLTAKLVGHALGKVFTDIGNIIMWPFKKAFAFIKAGLNWLKGIPGTIAHGAGSLLHSATFGLLHTGGPVRTHFDAGGPVGTDTVPGWLTPGEFVLNRATTSRIGMPALNRLNEGGSMGGGENITIVPGQTIIQVDGRTLANAVVRYTLQRSARGPTSLTGGGLLVGSATSG